MHNAENLSATPAGWSKRSLIRNRTAWCSPIPVYVFHSLLPPSQVILQSISVSSIPSRGVAALPTPFPSPVIARELSPSGWSWRFLAASGRRYSFVRRRIARIRKPVFCPKSVSNNLLHALEAQWMAINVQASFEPRAGR
jgi:hypothetical protein